MNALMGGGSAGGGTAGQQAYNARMANPFGGNQGGLTGFTSWANQPFDWQGFREGLAGFGDGAFQTILDTAGGKNLMGNPFLDATYGQAAENLTDTFNQGVLPNIAAQFGSAGRTGGGLHHSAVGQSAGQLTDSLADLSNQIYGGNYQLERDRMLGAATGLMDLYNTGSSEALARLGLAGNMFNQAEGRAVDLAGQNTQQRIAADNRNAQMRIAEMGDAFNRWDAAQGYGMDAARLGAGIYGTQLGAGTNALGMIPGLLGMGQASDMQQIQNLLAAGGLTEGFDQRGIDEAMARHYYPYQSQLGHLQAYQGLLGPPVMENRSSSSQSQRSGSKLGGLIGGGLALASMIPGPWQVPAMIGGMGANAMMGGGNYNSPLAPAGNPAATPWFTTPGDPSWMNPGGYY